MAKKGVYIINLGTPDSTQTSDVRKYLREFLMDEKVIDIPYLNRWLLVNLIIAPLRSPKSAAEYKRLWTDRGSPLMYHGSDLEAALQKALGDEYQVVFGMRYQNPSINSTLKKFANQDLDEIIAIPLYPQYAEASTGSTIKKVNQEAKKIEGLPKIKFIDKFPNNELFIKAFKDLAVEKWSSGKFDHMMFSYHGLPERQILKTSTNNYCKLNENGCCSTYSEKNANCYRAQCYETSRKLAEALNIKKEDYTVCFQSRLGKSEWIKPYTDQKIDELAEQGKKNVLVMCPAFTADCLETTVEVGETYNEQFLEKGGEGWELIPSLNTSQGWIDCLVDMVKTN